MDTTQVAVITIPVQEWNEQKAMIKSLCEKVGKLTDKEEKELLTPKEVCEMLKIGRTTYQRYVIDGTLEPVKVSKKKYSKVYVRRSDIEDMIKEGNM
jgi:excisionase family DNA binding protein